MKITPAQARRRADELRAQARAEMERHVAAMAVIDFRLGKLEDDLAESDALPRKEEQR